MTATSLCPGPVRTEFPDAAGINEAADGLPAIFWSGRTWPRRACEGLENGKRDVVPGGSNRVTAIGGSTRRGASACRWPVASSRSGETGAQLSPGPSRSPAAAGTTTRRSALRPADDAPAREQVHAPTKAPARTPASPRVETVATGLEVPWEIAFLPDGRALVTERPGRVRLLRVARLSRGAGRGVEVARSARAACSGSAVDPSPSATASSTSIGPPRAATRWCATASRATRLRERERDRRGDRAGPIHDGGRIQFGPDGQLYFAAGDAGDDRAGQEQGSLNGKILRMEPSLARRGGRPEIFSLGHRNPQGFDWQPRGGRLVANEHGPDGDDEVNLMREGANYGWPEATGEETHDGSRPRSAVYPDSIAPSGASFVTRPARSGPATS